MKKTILPAVTLVKAGFLLCTLLLAACGQNKTDKPKTDNTNTGTSPALTDEGISNAYIYLLGRSLALRQERADFEEGFEWNKLIHRDPGGVAWANPNLDVAYSEAWVALDENTCVLLEIPKITGRYYTWHMLNGWGETVLNINERTFPKQPFGKYALCLKGGNPTIPAGALRVDVPVKFSRVLARVELGNNTKEAVRLQHLFKLTPTGKPKVEKPFEVPLYTNDKMPGAEMFDNATAMLASEADINPGMETQQANVKAVEALVKSGAAGKERVDKIIKEQSLPKIVQTLHNLGMSKNGWTRPRVVGNYENEYLLRTTINFAGIWANNMAEVTYFGKIGIEGSDTYTLTFPKVALPASKAKYFWSVIAVDGKEFKVIPNPLNRYLLNNQSRLKNNADGSLTLVFGPKKPEIHPESNWLPTPAGQKYNLTFRFYGPASDVTGGQYFPPELVKVQETSATK